MDAPQDGVDPVDSLVKLEHALIYLRKKGALISIVNLPDIIMDVYVKTSLTNSELTKLFENARATSRLRVEDIETHLGGHAAITTKAQLALLSPHDPVCVSIYGAVNEKDFDYLTKELTDASCKLPDIHVHKCAGKRSISIPVITCDGDFIITGSTPQLSLDSLTPEELAKLEQADCIGLVSLRAQIAGELLAAIRDGRLAPRGVILADASFGTDEKTNQRVLENLRMLSEIVKPRTDSPVLLSFNEHEARGFAKHLTKLELDAHQAAQKIFEEYGMPILLHTHGGCTLIGERQEPFVPALEITPKIPFGTGDTLNGIVILSMLIQKKLALLKAPFELSLVDCLLIGTIAAAFKAVHDRFGSVRDLYDYILNSGVHFKKSSELAIPLEESLSRARAAATAAAETPSAVLSYFETSRAECIAAMRASELHPTSAPYIECALGHSDWLVRAEAVHILKKSSVGRAPTRLGPSPEARPNGRLRMTAAAPLL
ncbi:MAG: hypothetical protein QXG98_03730 [Candidatus Micrarchaeia archaeon]